MGYLKNHLATMVTGVFAAVMTLLWPYFNGFAPVLDFIFLMAVPISWFLVIVLWLAQKSTDYMHGQAHSVEEAESEKHAMMHDTTGEVSISPDNESMKSVKDDLSNELDSLRKDVKLKDEQIERLQKQISTLKTRVQIESIRAELAKLRALASD